jgi:hypothetical protein
LLEALVDVTFKEWEQSSRLVQFEVAGSMVHHISVLLTGSIPHASQFVKGIHPPLIVAKLCYTAWQEVK